MKNFSNLEALAKKNAKKMQSRMDENKKFSEFDKMNKAQDFRDKVLAFGKELEEKKGN